MPAGASAAPGKPASHSPREGWGWLWSVLSLPDDAPHEERNDMTSLSWAQSWREAAGGGGRQSPAALYPETRPAFSHQRRPPPQPPRPRQDFLEARFHRPRRGHISPERLGEPVLHPRGSRLCGPLSVPRHPVPTAQQPQVSLWTIPSGSGQQHFHGLVALRGTGRRGGVGSGVGCIPHFGSPPSPSPATSRFSDPGLPCARASLSARRRLTQPPSARAFSEGLVPRGQTHPHLVTGHQENGHSPCPWGELALSGR